MALLRHAPLYVSTRLARLTRLVAFPHNIAGPLWSTCRPRPPTISASATAIRPLSAAASRLGRKVEVAQQQDVSDNDELAKESQLQHGRKGARKIAGKTSSLRSIAVEAQNARNFVVKSRGGTRFIDPDAETKTVTAYCAAEIYDLSTAARLVKAQGYDLDPYQTGLFPQVIHVQISEKPSEVKDYQQGDIFIFPSGTVVAWNVREREALKFINQILPPAAEGSHLDLLETEDLDYLEDPSKETSQVVGDTIVLGTKAEPADHHPSDPSSPSHPNTTNTSPTTILHPTPPDQRHEVDTILAKIAFSSGLARSTKLAVLETLLSNYQHSTRDIPTMLASSQPTSLPKRTKAPFTRSFILRKTGELLSIRAQLNLYSELTDSMPDIFWDSRHELGLGEYYDQVGRALDVGVRIKVLNDKIGFAQEIAAVLREQLSEKHGLRLEWAIIALIAVEVVLEFYRHWVERVERDDPGSVEALLRQYLTKVMREEDEETKEKASVTTTKNQI
ncbi:hypothetical protein LEMA_P096120.1 [Plenodomus lingam JN3]|uniref:DUF155 domain-containing protein n=1 Tax=Leptosphaeria maculans (strain JN3 / isolate v23.1.3 / race Av1-4-5-6-7-8) TaxID=985895 RepID=E5A3J0_LEPMJ|nr:hypothetical protein LEMA_P096120.1 [Plenodomus lingam JN3]CBX98203.1 hypothetical protein LEMA_P096120.1 [Plenodomus lingam JN3]